MRFKTCLAAATLSAAFGAATAATVVLSPTGAGTFGTSFVETVADGSIIDDFSFTPASFAGLVSVALSSLTGPVTFTNGQINDQLFGNLSADLFHFSFQAQVTADAPLTLTVLRAVEDTNGNPVGTGSYGVAITAVAAAVPEPQTWALLLTGLCAIGFAARRGREKSI